MDNEKRVFEDLLSVDAWHFEFNESNQETAFHALVVFHRTKLGGDGDVSFTLKLRRARFEVGLPYGFKVPAETILQIAPRGVSHRRTDTKQTTSGFSLSGLLKTNSPSIDINAQRTATIEHGETTESSIETNIVEAKAGWNAQKVWWDFRSIDNLPLDGPVWASEKTERMSIRDTRREAQRLDDIQKAIYPPLEVRVTCLREDLEIDISSSIAGKLNGKNMAAAESYIRDVLTNRRLEFEGELSLKQPHARIELASGFAGIRKHE